MVSWSPLFLQPSCLSPVTWGYFGGKSLEAWARHSPEAGGRGTVLAAGAEGYASADSLLEPTFRLRILVEVNESDVLKEVKSLGLGFELRVGVANKLTFWTGS